MANRRDFLKTLLAGSGGVLLAAEFSATGFGKAFSRGFAANYADDPWLQVPQILSRIKAPVFPARDFPVTRFGAVGNGKTDCTEAFRKAIAACNKAGGGRVVVAPGEFSTGAIHLKSNVNLHLVKGA